MASKNFDFVLNTVSCQDLNYICGGCSCVCSQPVGKVSGQGVSPESYCSIKDFRESKYQKGIVLLIVATDVNIYECSLKCSNKGLSMQECVDES